MARANARRLAFSSGSTSLSRATFQTSALASQRAQLRRSSVLAGPAATELRQKQAGRCRGPHMARHTIYSIQWLASARCAGLVKRVLSDVQHATQYTSSPAQPSEGQQDIGRAYEPMAIPLTRRCRRPGFWAMRGCRRRTKGGSVQTRRRLVRIGRLI